jgi:hypothetical protein
MVRGVSYQLGTGEAILPFLDEASAPQLPRSGSDLVRGNPEPLRRIQLGFESDGFEVALEWDVDAIVRVAAPKEVDQYVVQLERRARCQADAVGLPVRFEPASHWDAEGGRQQDELGQLQVFPPADLQRGDVRAGPLEANPPKHLDYLLLREVPFGPERPEALADQPAHRCPAI